MIISNRRTGVATIDFRDCPSNYTGVIMRKGPCVLEYIEYRPGPRSLSFTCHGQNPKTHRMSNFTKIKTFDFQYVQFWKTPKQIMVTTTAEPIDTSVANVAPGSQLFKMRSLELPNFNFCYCCLGAKNKNADDYFDEKIKAFWTKRFDAEVDRIKTHKVTLNYFAQSYTLTLQNRDRYLGF